MSFIGSYASSTDDRKTRSYYSLTENTPEMQAIRFSLRSRTPSPISSPGNSLYASYSYSSHSFPSCGNNVRNCFLNSTTGKTTP